MLAIWSTTTAPPEACGTPGWPSLASPCRHSLAPRAPTPTPTHSYTQTCHSLYTCPPRCATAPRCTCTHIGTPPPPNPTRTCSGTPTHPQAPHIHTASQATEGLCPPYRQGPPERGRVMGLLSSAHQNPAVPCPQSPTLPTRASPQVAPCPAHLLGTLRPLPPPRRATGLCCPAPPPGPHSAAAWTWGAHATW